MVLLDCFWALGACLEVLLAAAVMPWGGWRLLLAISALPALAFVFAAATWVPESARFNAARGEVIRRKQYRSFPISTNTISISLDRPGPGHP